MPVPTCAIAVNHPPLAQNLCRVTMPPMKTYRSTTEDTLKPGHYRHYKGRDYELIGVAKHSETGEQLVVYRCLYGDFDLWVRPQAMFQESVELGGETVPRFCYVGPMPDTTGEE